MSELIPFQFESFSIRTIVIDGAPWFVGKDVADALGYKDPTTAIRSHCRGVQKLHPIVDSLGRTQEARIVNEPDLYRLASGSTLPEAERFEKWVFEDVLPTIRKTGSYTAPGLQERVVSVCSVAREIARALRGYGLKGNMLALASDAATKRLTGESVLEWAGQTHLLADHRGMTYTPTELGKMMDSPLSAKAFNRLLEAAGLQTKELDHWMPTSAALGLYEWLDTGKRHSDGTPVKQLKWFKSVLERI